MKEEPIFTQLNDKTKPLDARKRLLVEHIKQAVESHDDKHEQEREAAYNIAGLMATATAQELEDDNPIMKVLLMAGQLELPESQREAGVSWDKLKRLVHNIAEG